jgi:hypothetical protein
MAVGTCANNYKYMQLTLLHRTEANITLILLSPGEDV